MLPTDPYSPPQVSMAGPTPSDQAGGAMRYAGFWRRTGAYLIDFLIFCPLVAASFYFGGKSRLFELYALVPGQLFGAALYLYMVVRYGGTFGKLALGMRIVKLDGSAVGYREAALRYSVIWALTFGVSVLKIIAALGMTDENYLGQGFMERAVAMSASMPLIGALSLALQLWMIGCIISIVASSKKRALHDFMAGTVVVKK